jgi:hypothetical protein
MKLTTISGVVLVLVVGMFFLTACKIEQDENLPTVGREPVIEPDYSGVTIPPNIAPMNFIILEKGKFYNISVTSTNGTGLSFNSKDGVVRFSLKTWRKLLENSQGGRIGIEVISETEGKNDTKYDPIYMNIAKEKIDPYLCYRLLYPGYRSWVEMKIVQRSIEDFEETSLFENQLLKDNCVNCHSFKQNDPDRFLLHVRGSLGGTYFVDGTEVTKTTLKTQNMPVNAVYPAWHPSGKYVAFSSNKTVQTFHMRPEKNIEVFDLFSSLVIYDVEKNEMFACQEKDTIKYMGTFPYWSADGDYLYYCRTKQIKGNNDLIQVKYDLVRKSFNQASCEFGITELVFNALEISKSVQDYLKLNS